jgi:hypothetical protein
MVTFSARRLSATLEKGSRYPRWSTSRPSRERKRLLPPPFEGPRGILIELWSVVAPRAATTGKEGGGREAGPEKPAPPGSELERDSSRG